MTRLATKVSKTRTSEISTPKSCRNQWGEHLENDMSTFKIEFAGNPNSCNIKINKKFCALLDSGAEESLIHTNVYNSIKDIIHLPGRCIMEHLMMT